MIKNIPSAQDFHDAGVEFSMMAYSTILDLLVVFEEYSHLDDEEMLEDYWDSSKGKLKNAATLLHQGIDFLLKSKICEVSPFLLIDNSPEKIPKKNSNNEIEYSDFFTHDASKLPKIYDAYCSPKLSDRFRQMYEDSRQRRNKIIHTIDGNLGLEVKKIILEAVELIQYFLSKDWVGFRREFLESSPEYHLHYENDSITQNLIWEFSVLKKLLPNSLFKNIYGHPKSTRFYRCEHCCHSDYIIEPPPTAYLNPNTPESTQLTCLACDDSFEVVRERCSAGSCRSNVISENTRECLVCGEPN